MLHDVAPTLADRGCFAVMNAAKTDGDIYVYGLIGSGIFGHADVTPRNIIEDLAAVRGVKNLNIHIHSPGGDVFDAVTINSHLLNFKAKRTVLIEGECSSAATVIAMTGDSIAMAEAGSFMIHEPWSGVIGSSSDMRQKADRLDQVRDSIVKIYERRTKNDPKKLKAWMAAETEMSAQQALERGFIDSIFESAAEKIAAAAFPASMHYWRQPASPPVVSLVPSSTKPEPTASMTALKALVARGADQKLRDRFAERQPISEGARK